MAHLISSSSRGFSTFDDNDVHFIRKDDDTGANVEVVESSVTHEVNIKLRGLVSIFVVVYLEKERLIISLDY